MTVDWLAKVLHEALGPLAVPGSWDGLGEGDRRQYELALTRTLEALDDPCLLKLREGEPIVCLRAQDEVAPRAFDGWLGLAIKAGMPSDGPKAIQAALKIAAMARWQDEHPELVKVPRLDG